MAKPVRNPRMRDPASTLGGLETKAPTMTANPIITELIGLMMETYPLRLKARTSYFLKLALLTL